MNLSFGSKELTKALIKLGFCADTKHSGTSHIKYCINLSIPGVRPFITVVGSVKRYDPHTASCFISQIREKGFNNKQIEKAFGKK